VTAGLLAGRMVSAPALESPLGDALPASLYLSMPKSYLLLAPLFTLWDGVTMLSATRLQGFLGGLPVLYAAGRLARIAWLRYAWSAGPAPRSPWRHELRLLAIAAGLLLAFVSAGALWHRPMLALSGHDPDDVAVDFHSHTNVSHDVRHTLMGHFDTGANLRWHQRGGFDAVFVTDHNTVAGLRPQRGLPALCPGIEVSAWKAHIVLLGDSQPVDQGRYNHSRDELLALLGTSDSAYGALSVASLPEYERNHWARLDELVAAGLDGFEIVNAAPRANEFTRGHRDSVIALARRTNRFLVGATDTHGWGATAMVWNLVRVPGWHGAPEDVCPAVLQQLRHGFGAVRIVERHRLRPDSRWPNWLTPLGVLWETWRSMGWALTSSWLVWVWLPWIARRRRIPSI
jgi:hypothetical protein